MPRRPALVLAALLLPVLPLLTGCGGVAAEVRSIPLALDPERPGADRIGALAFRGAVALEAMQFPGFGGLSGLWIGPDRDELVAISDRGGVITGALAHDPQGRLAGVGDVRVRPLPDLDGRPVHGARADSEELARLPDGRWVVAFERRHRLLAYDESQDRPAGRAVALPDPPGFAAMEGNSGVEALAALGDGRLVAIHEGSSETAVHQAWIGGAEGWQRLWYRTEPPFRPTGAAALPDGGLLVLERRVGILTGFSSRIVHVPAAQVVPGAVMEGEELARLERPLLSDNFEAIAAVPAGDGGIDIYLLSDDNFLPIQQTILALFRWSR